MSSLFLKSHYLPSVIHSNVHTTVFSLVISHTHTHTHTVPLLPPHFPTSPSLSPLLYCKFIKGKNVLAFKNVSMFYESKHFTKNLKTDQNSNVKYTQFSQPIGTRTPLLVSTLARKHISILTARQ